MFALVRCPGILPGGFSATYDTVNFHLWCISSEFAKCWYITWLQVVLLDYKQKLRLKETWRDLFSTVFKNSEVYTKYKVEIQLTLYYGDNIRSSTAN